MAHLLPSLGASLAHAAAPLRTARELLDQPRPFERRAPGADDHGWLLSLIALAFLAGTLWLYWLQHGR